MERTDRDERTFELYDLRVEIVRVREGFEDICNHHVGDYFEVEGENLRVPEGRTFSMYALAAVLPLLPAKQRPTHANDWMTTDDLVMCPDPNCDAVMRITRTGVRTFRTSEVTVVSDGAGEAGERAEAPPAVRDEGPAKRPLAFGEIRKRLRSARLPAPPEIDLVVGLATGGTAPALLVAHHLGLAVEILPVNYRDAANRPRGDAPRTTGDVPEVGGRRLLLVDDVSVSGATLAHARAVLSGAAAITTLVVKGPPGAADVVLFPDVPQCVRWPW